MPADNPRRATGRIREPAEYPPGLAGGAAAGAGLPWPAEPPGAVDRQAGPSGAAPDVADAGARRVDLDDEDRAARAAAALANVKSDAVARGRRSPASAEERLARRTSGSASSQQAAPARRERRDDPAPLAAAIDGLVHETGWELAVAAGSVFGRWSQIVGPDLAAHTMPEGLAEGELQIAADSTAWATQVRLLAGELVRRLNVELGEGTVRRVKVRGPGSQARRPGEWRVRGGRGPRDTYG